MFIVLIPSGAINAHMRMGSSSKADFQFLKRVSAHIARFLAVFYTSQTVRVQWNDSLSEPFSIRNGVKQGGVLSPILFTIYYDALLIELKKSGFGCHIGNTFMGALSYADDITLLAPTRMALRKMMSICTCNDFSIV